MKHISVCILIGLFSIVAGASLPSSKKATRSIAQGFIFRSKGGQFFLQRHHAGDEVPRQIIFESPNEQSRVCVSVVIASLDRCQQQMFTYIPGWHGRKPAYLRARLVEPEKARLMTTLPRIVYGALK